MNPALLTYITEVKSIFLVPNNRKGIGTRSRCLSRIRLTLNLFFSTYICTHNPRRSHFGQIWAATAAAYYQIPNVKTFSGGTESTAAFNERAAAACSQAGFEISKSSEGTNPVYEVKYALDAEPLKSILQNNNDPANPQNGFCAVMTCSQADKACPVVKALASRVAVS